MKDSTVPRSRCLLRLIGGLAGLLLTLALAACAPKKSPGPPPPWLDPATPKSDNEFFYGIGCAPREINNTWFQKATADERARVDLAKNVDSYLLTQLNGDTSAARAELERALPSRESNESYRTDKGELCVRARLPRSAIAISPPPARNQNNRYAELIAAKDPNQLIANIGQVLNGQAKYQSDVMAYLQKPVFFTTPQALQDITLFTAGTWADQEFCAPLSAIAADPEYVEESCVYHCGIAYAIYRCCPAYKAKEGEDASVLDDEIQSLKSIDPNIDLAEGEPEFADAGSQAQFEQMKKLPTDELIQILLNRSLDYETRWPASFYLSTRKLDRKYLPQLIYVIATDTHDGADEIQNSLYDAIIKLNFATQPRNH